MRSIFSVLSGIIAFLGYVPYIHGIVKRGKRPMKSTWFIWAVLDTLILATMAVQGALNPQIVAVVFGCWTVFVFTAIYGASGLSRLDLFCLAGAGVGIAFWLAFDTPMLGLLLGLSVTCLASVPTFVSAWKEPQNEDVTSWIIYTLGSVCAVVAIPAWTLPQAAQPIAFLWISCTTLGILLTRSRRNAVA